MPIPIEEDLSLHPGSALESFESLRERRREVLSNGFWLFQRCSST